MFDGVNLHRIFNCNRGGRLTGIVVPRWRGRETATKVLQAIMHYNPHVLAQVGNTDNWDVHQHLNQCGINLHGQGHRFGDVGIFGVGGSNYTT